MNHIRLITTLCVITSMYTLSGTQLPDPSQDSIDEIAQWMLEKEVNATQHFLNYYNDPNLEDDIKQYLLTTYQTQLQVLWPQLAQRVSLQYIGPNGIKCNYHTGITNAAVDATLSYMIASYWNDNATLLWNLKTNEYKQLPLGNAISTAAAFHPNNSQWAVTALNNGKDYWLNHWDLSSFGVQQSVKANNRCINAVIYTADNVVFSGGDDKQVFQKNLNNYDKATCIIKDTKAKVKKMAFSSELQLIATGGDDAKVRLWHLDGRLHNALDCSKRFIYYMPSSLTNGMKNAVPYHAPDSPGITSLQFNPAGTVLYVAFEYDTSWGAVLWDVVNDTVQDIAAWDRVFSYPCAFSPHGNFIFTYIGDYNSCCLQVHGVSNGYQKSFPTPDNLNIVYILPSPDGRYVYGMDSIGDVYYWEVVRNTEVNFNKDQLSLEQLITIIKQHNI